MKIYNLLFALVFVTTINATGCNTSVQISENRKKAIALNNKGVDLVSKNWDPKKIEQSLELYEKAIQLDSTFLTPYQNYHDAALDLRRYKEAIVIYEKSKKFMKDDVARKNMDIYLDSLRTLYRLM